jgi:glycosyltransferase involved in cell wall biosynthesis
VTYEGVDERVLKVTSNKLKVKNLEGQYFLYVGNVYPHKNTEMLVLAFKDFIHTQGKRNYRLIFVGKEDYFYTRLKNEIAKKGLQSSILFLGQVDDETLHDLYVHAEALVFPSLMEGFGLPALEALSLETPVICSDIPIFHEILNNFPYYINPLDRSDIAKSFSEVTQKKKSEMMQKRNEIVLLLKNYSWKKLGVDTLHLYNSLRIPSPSV